jgi:hypothetical protein
MGTYFDVSFSVENHKQYWMPQQVGILSKPLSILHIAHDIPDGSQ